MYSDRSGVTKNEADVLLRYASQVEGDVVEIGCWHGGTAAMIAAVCPKPHVVWSIDNLQSPSMSSAKEIAAYFREPGPWRDRVFLIVGFSVAVARYWCRPVGLLIIDGLHTYGQVKADFEHWVKWLLPNAVVTLHDAIVPDKPVTSLFGDSPPPFPGVTKFLAELLQTGQWELLETVDTTAVLKRVMT